jgi:hypothetical protein
MWGKTNIQRHAEAVGEHWKATYRPCYFLLSCDTGKVLFKGSKEECLAHFLNSPMAVVLPTREAFEFHESFNK